MPAKAIFEMPYIGVDTTGDFHLLIGAGGSCTVVLRITNPVLRYSADPAAYDDFHGAIVKIAKVLGEGYLIQKQDIISRSAYRAVGAEDYLRQKFNDHFEGRERLSLQTHLSITRKVKRGAFYTYDPAALRDFRQAVVKVIGILGVAAVLKETELNLLVLQMLSMNFHDGSISLNNIRPSDTEIGLGSRVARIIPLINIDSIDLPAEVGTHIRLNDNETIKGFPADFLSFLFSVPGCETIVYNQLIDIPAQEGTLRKLEQKKKRHSGIPDPANLLCVEDIDLLLTDVARENQLLVNTHFNIVLAGAAGTLDRPANFVESALFQLGVISGRNAYNQMELFRATLPGNGVELKEYDWFLTTCDAAACFFFKESLPADEPSDFLIRFTDRQGIPLGIDTADLPMRTNRINNRNMFVLGPSGSGKSFFMNALIEQYMLYNMDMVIIDTGHSYSGLCKYYNGRYITWSEKEPITMNPFQIAPEEWNIEKKDFLVTLIALAWKGTDGNLNSVERDIVAAVLSAYFLQAFAENTALNFNTFYEFALERIPLIKAEEKVPFDLDEFRYVLKKFYKGGEFETILNKPVGASLFTERFIVFEIDSIKDHKILFPIVTVIIIDVFIQKMRHRTSRRKALVLEEAWKALASPVMANFLLYLNKTVRKFWGSLIPVTQELSDMLGNPIIKDSLISNTDTICLLDQSKFKDNYSEIAALLSISEIERRKIFTINQLDNKDGRGRFKEVYIRRGNTGEVYGVEVSLHQYLTYTTEKPEKSAVELYVASYSTYPQALDAFVADLHTSGLPLQKFIAQVNLAGATWSAASRHSSSD